MKAKDSVYDYLLMVLLIFISGNPIFTNRYFYAVAGLVSLFVLFRYRRRYYWKQLMGYLGAFCIVFILQRLILGSISWAGSANLMLKICLGCAIMWRMKDRFRHVYLKTMSLLALVSLFFFALQAMGYMIPDWGHLGPETHGHRSIFIYTAIPKELRNCGPFWEPGAFACYLILVPMLFIGHLEQMLHAYPARSAILLTALISTFSTTGYVCLFILAVGAAMIQRRYRFFTYLVLLPAILVVGAYAFKNLDFLGDKIEEQYEVLDADRDVFSNTRFGSLIFDLHYIEKHPLVGNGLKEETRYADHPELWGEELGHGNGFSNFLAQMGIPLLILYFVLIYQNYPSAIRQRLLLIVVLLLLFQGEQLLNYPLCLALPFQLVDETAQTAQREQRRKRPARRRYRSLAG